MALGGRSIGSAALLSCGLLCVLVSLNSVWGPGATVARFYTAPILLEFVFGVALAFWFRAGIVLAAWAGISLLVGGGVVMCLLADAPPQSCLRGLPATAIVAGGLALERQIRRRPLALPKMIGDASYSIYLTHLFTVAFADVVWHHLCARLGGVTAWLYLAFGIAIAAGGGIACFRLVERPLHRWARAMVGHQRGRRNLLARDLAGIGQPRERIRRPLTGELCV